MAKGIVKRTIYRTNHTNQEIFMIYLGGNVRYFLFTLGEGAIFN